MKFLVLLIILGMAQAEARAQVMRWVDDDGVVNYGNAVPERYRKDARVVVIAGPPTEADQREAQARLAKEREVLARPPVLPASESGGEVVKARSEPPPSDREAASCEEQWRRFDAAWACFNPYRNANGSIKPEGYERCPNVRQPACER